MENIAEELGFLPIQKIFTSWRNHYLNICCISSTIYGTEMKKNLTILTHPWCVFASLSLTESSLIWYFEWCSFGMFLLFSFKVFRIWLTSEEGEKSLILTQTISSLAQRGNYFALSWSYKIVHMTNQRLTEEGTWAFVNYLTQKLNE